MRITARYSAFGLYETAILGILSQSTGWATAARRIVEAAAPIPVIGFGARHVHPASPTRWTTPPWSVAASAPRPRPARAWPGSPRPARCRTR